MFPPSIRQIRFHTGGQSMSLVTEGLGPVSGTTMEEKESFLAAEFGDLLRALFSDPRGSSEGLVAVLTEPVGTNSDFGLLYLSASGFLPSCGELTIGAVSALVGCGLFAPQADNGYALTIDTVGGEVQATYIWNGKRVDQVTLEMGSSYLVAQGCEIVVPSVGNVEVDIGCGSGNFFAVADAALFGLQVTKTDAQGILNTAGAVLAAVRSQVSLPPLPFGGSAAVSMVMLTEPLNRYRAKNVVVWGDGVLNRAPCVTGTCARLAILQARGELEADTPFTHEGILGTSFTAMSSDPIDVGNYAVIRPKVSGDSFVLATEDHAFYPEDPVLTGYRLS